MIMLLQLSKESVHGTTRQSKLMAKLALPGRVLKDQWSKLKSVFKPQALIAEGDEKKFVNAVLTYQLRSILQGMRGVYFHWRKGKRHLTCAVACLLRGSD
jgi:hypothetical protein